MKRQLQALAISIATATGAAWFMLTVFVSVVGIPALTDVSHAPSKWLDWIRFLSQLWWQIPLAITIALLTCWGIVVFKAFATIAVSEEALAAVRSANAQLEAVAGVVQRNQETSTRLNQSLADYQHALTLIYIVIPEATANLETVRVARQLLVAHFATPIGIDRGRGRVDYERHAMQLTPLPDFAHYARRVGWIAEGLWPNRPFEPPQHIENEENLSNLQRVNYATQVRNLLQEEHNWETLLDHAKTRAAAVVPPLAYA